MSLSLDKLVVKSVFFKEDCVVKPCRKFSFRCPLKCLLGKLKRKYRTYRKRSEDVSEKAAFLSAKVNNAVVVWGATFLSSDPIAL